MSHARFIFATLVWLAAGTLASTAATETSPEESSDAGPALDAGAPDPYDVSQYPPAIRGMLSRAGELVTQGDFGEAEVVIRRLLEEAPGNPAARSVLVSILIEQNRYEEVLVLFEEMMDGGEEDFRLLNNYSWFLSTATDPSHRNPAKALVLAQDAVFLAPNVINIWSTLAEAHFVNGNFDRAYRAQLQCVELAVRQGLRGEQIEAYRRQLARFQEAASVMSLVE